MELTAKMLEEIKAAAQKALETSPQSRATSTVILALVTELERRGAENAALREAMEDIVAHCYLSQTTTATYQKVSGRRSKVGC